MPTPRTPRARGGQPPIWTRDFTLATSTNLLLAMVFMASIVTMAPYAVRELGATEPQAGAVASIFVVGALLTRPFAGRYLDVLGRRRIVVVGIGLQVGALALYFLADTLALLLVVRVLHGMAFGLVNTAMAASVISLLPPRRRSEGTGYFGMSGVIAGAVGPLYGVPVLMGPGPQVLFAVFTGLAVLAFSLSLLLRLPSPAAPAPRPRPRARRRSVGPVLRSLLEPTVIPVASVMLVAGAAFSSVMTYMSLYTPSLGMEEMTTVFFVVYSASVLLVRPFAGRLHDSRGDNTIIYPSLLSLAVALAVISVARTPAVLLLGAVFLALGFGTLMSSMQAIAVTLAPRDRVGVATATFFLMLDIGTGLGPILLGFAVAYLGYSPMYLVMAAITLVAVGLYYLTHGGTPNRRSGPLPDDPPEVTDQ
ncbi:MFS transporter [Pseudactinotalea sp. Z1739]|uniref:MFS transporter n=1 Tax=Pseudactinotalea sp. Z1739 TaxID=3413028 RepID=UPI003C7B2F4C